LAGASLSVQQKLSQGGRVLGRAFQLEDDIGDYTLGPKDSGKDARSDLASGLVTLPLILALDHEGGHATMLRRHLSSRGREGLDPRSLERLFVESGAFERCLRLTRGLRRRGLRAVPGLEASWHTTIWSLSA
jgi:geranylgeranyl pyrophosphate synthase